MKTNDTHTQNQRSSTLLAAGTGFKMKLFHLRSAGTSFSQGACNLDPSHAPFTVGFVLLWESNATADLMGGGAWAVVLACPLLTSDGCPPFLTGRGWVPTCSPGLGSPTIHALKISVFKSCVSVWHHLWTWTCSSRQDCNPAVFLTLCILSL